MPRQGLLGSCPRAAPTCPHGIKIAVATPAMSEREDYGFKRRDNQGELMTSFSQHEGCPNAQVTLLVKDQRRSWQHSGPPMLHAARG